VADLSQQDFGLFAAPEMWFTIQCPHSGCETDLWVTHIPYAESLTEEFMAAQSIRLNDSSKEHIRSHDDG
jgi:hypothetical protein